MLNPTEEKKYEELKDKCRELRVPPPPDIMIGLQVHDENGILVFDDIQRGHSWSRWYWNCGADYLTGARDSSGTPAAGELTLKDSGGATRASNAGGIQFAVGLDASSAYGIIVGTGDTAFSVEQYWLASQIIHGTSAGQFSHTAQSAWSFAYTAGTKTWKSTGSRIYNNNSGGSITVKETGIASNNSAIVLMERSVLSPTVTVATGGQLTVTYEISMDFSAID